MSFLASFRKFITSDYLTATPCVDMTMATRRSDRMSRARALIRSESLLSGKWTSYFRTERSAVLNASGRAKKGACPLSIKIASPCELGIFFAR